MPVPPRALRIENDDTRQAGELVHLLGDGDAVDEVLELELARHLGDNRVSMRIPVRDDLALLDLRAVIDRDRRTVRHLVALTLAARSLITEISPERETATR